MGIKKQIVYKKLNEIYPYANNPRFNDDAVEYVKNSIKQFHFQNPIIISPDGEIVAGHTRYKASLELGLEEVPCIVADDLTEEQIKAFRLADNKVSEKAKWNYELLDEELDDILDIDMSQFDFHKLDDIDLSQFIEDMPDKQIEEKKTMVKCPCCEEVFELKDEYIQ